MKNSQLVKTLLLSVVSLVPTRMALGDACGMPMFAGTRVFSASGDFPKSGATGDFNGDGNADLAIANLSSNNVSVLLGNGNGTFQTAVTYSTGASPTFVVVSDFNGDRKPDLAVVNGSNISVLLGNGDGTFKAAVNYAGSGTRWRWETSTATANRTWCWPPPVRASPCY
jgi:hypothetical protein